MEAGITLQQFDVKYPMAPRTVMKSFNSVQTAQSQAKQKREQAEGEAKNRLLKSAGEGATVILAQIDQYERDLAGGNPATAAATLQTIHDFMRRKPISIDGKPVIATVSGDVSKTVAEAEQYRTGVVTRASGDASSFTAKLASFKANPQVFLTGEWTDAVGFVLTRDNVTTMLLPPGLERLLVQINRDPWVAQEMQAREGAKKVEQNLKDINNRRRNELWNKNFDGTSHEAN
jgi:regulator of protease activity HflC (stomatin/prohibitin superfamily)